MTNEILLQKITECNNLREYSWFTIEYNPPGRYNLFFNYELRNREESKNFIAEGRAGKILQELERFLHTENVLQNFANR